MAKKPEEEDEDDDKVKFLKKYVLEFSWNFNIWPPNAVYSKKVFSNYRGNLKSFIYE